MEISVVALFLSLHGAELLLSEEHWAGGYNLAGGSCVKVI